jgi:hypothetical protein
LSALAPALLHRAARASQPGRAGKIGYETSSRRGPVTLQPVLRHGNNRLHQPSAVRPACPEPRPPAEHARAPEHPIAVAGRQLARYGVVVVIAWIGALKYSSY